MPTPSPCGIRFAHGPHKMSGRLECPGRPWPEHYEPKHRNLADYKPELDWTAEAAPRMGRHRADGDCRIIDEPHRPRPWLRIGWRDDDKNEQGRASAWVAATCIAISGMTGMSSTSIMTSFDQLIRPPVLVAKKSEN